MSQSNHVWGLVLAAGEGSRLRTLTTRPCGTSVPKQFCSLHGGHTLLEDAIHRAQGFTDDARICTIVAQQHREWWLDPMQSMSAANVIVQPRNKGTAIGVLYSLLHILPRDPDAKVVLLPADHYVRDEAALQRSLHEALACVERNPAAPVLLGLKPEEVDPELGYIVPGTRDAHGAWQVTRFVEKPALPVAREIISQGGLWNTFIIAASAQTLLNMYLPKYAPIVMEMSVIMSRTLQMGLSVAAGWGAILDMYGRLPELDFSRDVLEGREHALRVLDVPACGWSDLGTPKRVAETLQRLNPSLLSRAARPGFAALNLAIQHANLQRAAARASA